MEEEVVKILLSASLSLSSILVAVIGILLGQYISLKYKPEADYVLRSYQKLIWIMVSALVLGAVTTLASLFYLLNVDVYYAIVVLFVVLISTVVLGVFYTVLKIVREKHD